MEEGEWRCRSYLGCLAAPKNVQSTCSIFMHASLLLQSGYLWIWINFGLLAYMATTYLYMWKPAPHWHKLIFKPSLVLLFFFFFKYKQFTLKNLFKCVSLWTFTLVLEKFENVWKQARYSFAPNLSISQWRRACLDAHDIHKRGSVEGWLLAPIRFSCETCRKIQR